MSCLCNLLLTYSAKYIHIADLALHSTEVSENQANMDRSCEPKPTIQYKQTSIEWILCYNVNVHYFYPSLDQLNKHYHKQRTVLTWLM